MRKGQSDLLHGFMGRSPIGRPALEIKARRTPHHTYRHERVLVRPEDLHGRLAAATHDALGARHAHSVDDVPRQAERDELRGGEETALEGNKTYARAVSAIC